MSGELHVCDDGCVCPIHGTPLFYWPSGGDHACQDVDCVHGHGGVTPGVDPVDLPTREGRATLVEATEDRTIPKTRG